MTFKGQDAFYVFLSSEDCKHIYPLNTAQDFVVHLPERIKLYGHWTVALAEIKYPSKFKGDTPHWLYLEADLCTGDGKMAVLRRLPVTASHLNFNPLFYLPIRHREFDKIHIHIRDPSGFICPRDLVLYTSLCKTVINMQLTVNQPNPQKWQRFYKAMA